MSEQDKAGLHQVDVPVTVPPEMAEDMVEDLEEKGRITVQITQWNAPDIVEQLRWQLENDQPLLEFTEDHRDDE